MAEKDQECKYCLEKLTSSSDARRLPCGHSFCLKCMTSDFAQDDSAVFKCRTCSEVHEDIDLASLPSADVNEDSPEEDLIQSETSPEYCDRCKHRDAEVYCVDCGEKICDHHLEYHKGYYEDLHRLVAIGEYVQDKGKYCETKRCDKHPSEVIKSACNRCFVYGCMKCLIFSSRCSSGYQQHNFLSLPTIQAEIKTSITQLLDDTANKLANIDNYEKEAWKNYDNLPGKCEEMIKDVERRTEEQIEFIKKQSQELIDRIKRYQEEKSNHVVALATKYEEKREELREVIRKNKEFLQNVSLEALLEEQNARKEEINTANQQPPASSSWPQQELRIGGKLKMQLDFTDSLNNPGVPETSTAYCGQNVRNKNRCNGSYTFTMYPAPFFRKGYEFSQWQN